MRNDFYASSSPNRDSTFVHKYSTSTQPDSYRTFQPVTQNYQPGLIGNSYLPAAPPTFPQPLDTDVDPKELEQYLEPPSAAPKKIPPYAYKGDEPSLLELQSTPAPASLGDITPCHASTSFNSMLALPESSANMYYFEMPYQYPHAWESYSSPQS